MKVIYTAKGDQIYVSDEDYSLLSRHTWDIDSGGYPRTSILSKHIRMHQLVHPASRSMVTDHINRNKLDNRRENLREITHAENNYNAEHFVGATGYIGVYKRGNSYYAIFSYQNKQRHIPSGNNAEDTAVMRDYVAWKIRGQFAVLNFPKIDYAEFEHPKKEVLDSIIKTWTGK